ncbi:hypothetical protein [Streptomyces sp. NPDC053560]|uniref:hypothetical protein n=1 Tax=Streptomyces sp. NPDC053560 TaxID=3365711 RepID=UPI0037D523BB
MPTDSQRPDPEDAPLAGPGEETPDASRAETSGASREKAPAASHEEARVASHEEAPAAAHEEPFAECVLCRASTEYPESTPGIVLCPRCEWQEAQRTACSG